MKENIMPVLIDLKNFYDITGRDKDLEEELFSDFIRKSETNLDAMNTALKSGDKISWEENAHMMKGACRMLGAFILADLMAKAETCAIDERHEFYRRILESFDDVKKFLAEEIQG
jgi:HPt (histidine-containing phosphotransfer) domain-containing protein